MKVWAAILYKLQEWHACALAVFQKLAIGCLVFEPSELKFKAHLILLLGGLSKRGNIMHNR